MALFLVAFLVIDRLITGYRYRRLDNRARVCYRGKRSLRLLKLIRQPISQGETLAELAMRAEANLPEEYLTGLKIYERALYSAGEITGEDVAVMEAAERALIKYSFKKLAPMLK